MTRELDAVEADEAAGELGRPKVTIDEIWASLTLNEAADLSGNRCELVQETAGAVTALPVPDLSKLHRNWAAVS